MQTAPTLTAFTTFDWILVVIVVVSTLMAFYKGLIRVLLSLGGVVVGIIIASWNYILLADALHRWISSFEVAEIIGFLVIFFLVVIAIAWIAKLLRSAVKAIGLGFLDRLLGGVVGFVRGVLLGVVLLMALTAFAPGAPWAENSQLAPYFLDGVHAVSFVVPLHLQDQISNGAQYLLHETPELVRPHTLTQHM